MHRQKSILSFLQKPSPDNQNSGGSKLNGQQVPHFPVKQLNQTANAAHQPIQPPALSIPSTLDEIRGTDTPPEKVPRRVFPVNCTTIADDNKGPSLFSSIKHKFVKVDGRENSCDRKEMNVGSPYFRSISSEVNDRPILSTKNIVTEHIEKESPLNLYKSVNQGDKGCPISIEIDDDIPGPETPGMRPLIPRLKRVQEDGNNFEGKNDSSLRDPFKRVKFLQDTKLKSEKHEEASEMTTRFEWLDPSKIKDANGRRPSDPLYNKRTLYIPPDALKKMSASQKQYWSVKSQYMDLILFFKVGKFYELYEVDAETGHKELDWKMTFSGVGKCRQSLHPDGFKIELQNPITQSLSRVQVGISEGGIDDAVQKLLARGYKVGRIEQLETSEQAKSRGSTSVIQRKLVQVLTPSTTIEGNIGPDAVRLLAIKEDNMGQENGSTAYGFAFVDCAALKFWVGSVSDDASCSALGALLMQVSPKEIIYEFGGISNEAQKVLKKYSLAGSVASQLTPAQPAIDFIDPSEVRDLIKLKGYFKGSCDIEDDNAFNGVMHNDLALNALGGLISHLSRLMLVDDLRNGDLLPYEVYKGCLRMDGQTLVNLEIFSNNDDGGSSGTLYKYLDNCVTSSGKRLLRSWICHPLNDIEKINFRLNMVEELMSHPEVVLLIAQTLQKLPDLERMLGRIKATFQSSASLLLPLIGKKLLKQRVKVFGSLVKGLRVAMDMLILLQKEGLMISSLSKVVNIPTLSGSDGLDKFLTQFEAAIDSDFPNYQDHDVKDSDSEMLAILTEMFIEKGNQWSQIIHTINCIDVLRSFAVIAKFSSGPMCRPIVLPNSGLTNEFKGPTLKFQGLWHPFALVGDNGGGLPVPNDIHLGEDSDVGGYQARSLLLTGPNMGGKSTLLRATCLAVILAQLGCYVPCKMCVVSLVDIIFTRLGATDHIMTGESTFFIECKETASVLQNATQDSLIILDELGRGTSTFDGYAIAYAVFRHLVEKVNCRLLFATHYHPLTKEFKSHPHVTLQHMACTFKSNSENASQGNRDLVFLYKLAAGACPESYGMQVALMAGIPKSVVESASKAGRVMKKMIGENFRSCERRSEFSTLHEEWLKTILTVSKIDEGSDDVLDTLFCLWHELKCSFK